MFSRAASTTAPDVPTVLKRSQKRSLVGGSNTLPTRLPPISGRASGCSTLPSATATATLAARQTPSTSKHSSHVSCTSATSAAHEILKRTESTRAGGGRGSVVSLGYSGTAIANGLTTTATATTTLGSAGGARRNAGWQRVLRLRAQGNELLRRQPDPLPGLRELGRALALQATLPGGLADPVAAPAGVVGIAPMWACAEEMVAAAMAGAAQRAAAAEPLEETHRCIHEALRLVRNASEDGESFPDPLSMLAAVTAAAAVGGATPPSSSANGASEGNGIGRSGGACGSGGGRRRRTVVVTAADTPAPAGPSLPDNSDTSSAFLSASASAVSTDYFRSFPELRQHLYALVLNNVAAHLHSLGRPLREVKVLLMSALHRTGGVLATGLLYNLAVAHAGAAQLSEASDIADRAAVLCAVYLRVDPRGEEATALDAVELADTYTTFVACMATHMVAVQLLSATCAAYVSDFPRELAHCQVAVSCARAFLPAAHPLQRRCAARQLAAERRAIDHTPHDPPQLPMMVLSVNAPFSRSPMMSSGVVVPQLSIIASAAAAAAADEMQPSADGMTAYLRTVPTAIDTPTAAAAARAGDGSDATAPSFTSLPLSRWLQRWGSVSVPSTVRAYVRTIGRRLLQLREAHTANTASRSRRYSNNTAGTARARYARTQSHASQIPPQPLSRTSSRRDRNLATSRGASQQQQQLSPSMPTSPAGDAAQSTASFHTPHPPRGQTSSLHPSVRAPVVITELPRKALERYRHLTDAALGYLDGLTGASAAAEGAEGDAGESLVERGAAVGEHGALAADVALSKGVDSRVAYDWESHRCRRRQLSTVYYVPNASDSEEAAYAAAASAASQPLLLSRQQPLTATTSAGRTSSTLTVLPPATQMRAMDVELLRYSQLVVDPLPEIRASAARAIQCLWRQHKARLVRQSRSVAIQVWIRQSEAAAVILTAHRTSRACQPAKLELHALQQARYTVCCVTLVQQYLRARAGVEEWGQRCLKTYTQLAAARAQHEREAAAAVMVQAWWRMVRQRTLFTQLRRAALRVGCAWRQWAARRVLAHRRALARDAYDAFAQAHRRQIVLLQRWYRACISRRAVAATGLLETHQAAVAAHLEAEEASFEANMGPWATDLERVGSAAVTVMSVLKGAKARKELGRRCAALARLRRALTQWVLRTRGALQIALLRTERREGLRLQRRNEEVQAAAICIQSGARAWLRRHHQQTNAQHRSTNHRAASKIQATYRAYRERTAGTRLPRYRDENDLHADVRHMQQLRTYSATRIQATYRMYRTRAQLRDFLRFMRVDRHAIALRLQRWWRGCQARLAVHQRREWLRERHRCEQAEDAYRVAVTRVQSVVRMYLARCRVARTLVRQQQRQQLRRRSSGGDSTEEAAMGNDSSSRSSMHMGWHTPYQRFCAARSIQRVWRGYAARGYTQQLRLATAHYAITRTTEEALHAYATIIQKVVRTRILSLSPFPNTDSRISRSVALVSKGRGSSSDPVVPTLLTPVTPRPLRSTTTTAAGHTNAFSGIPQAPRPETAPSSVDPALSGGMTALSSQRVVKEETVVISSIDTAPDTSSQPSTGVVDSQVAQSQGSGRATDNSAAEANTAVTDAFSAERDAGRPRYGCGSGSDTEGDDGTEGGFMADEGPSSAVEVTADVVEVEEHESSEEPAASGVSYRDAFTRNAPEAMDAEDAEEGADLEEEEEVGYDEESEDDEETDTVAHGAFHTLEASAAAHPRTSRRFRRQCQQQPSAAHTASRHQPPADAFEQDSRVSASAAMTSTKTSTTSTSTSTSTSSAVAITARDARTDGASTPATVTRRLSATSARNTDGISTAGQVVESFTARQHAAATRIQALWRGYVIRCVYEFYYEEYEEEVDVDEFGNEI